MGSFMKRFGFMSMIFLLISLFFDIFIWRDFQWHNTYLFRKLGWSLIMGVLFAWINTKSTRKE